MCRKLSSGSKDHVEGASVIVRPFFVEVAVISFTILELVPKDGK